MLGRRIWTRLARLWSLGKESAKKLLNADAVQAKDAAQDAVNAEAVQAKEAICAKAVKGVNGVKGVKAVEAEAAAHALGDRMGVGRCNYS